MVSAELLGLANRGSHRRAIEHAFLPDQDVHIQALVGLLRQLADGISLRTVLDRAVALGLRPDAFPDLDELLAPPLPHPRRTIESAVNAALALANLAVSTEAEAKELIEAYGYRVDRQPRSGDAG